jgi:hypothetical protein
MKAVPVFILFIFFFYCGSGGDGTFLMGASKISNRFKPIVGINTDPTRSEGHLCLPKHFSFNIQANEHLLRLQSCALGSRISYLDPDLKKWTYPNLFM